VLFYSVPLLIMRHTVLEYFDKQCMVLGTVPTDPSNVPSDLTIQAGRDSQIG